MVPLKALVLADAAPFVPLEQLLREHPIDVVLTLGDLKRSHLEPLAAFTGPKLGVHGNHDDGDEFDDLGIEDLHLRVVELGGRLIGGFAGSHRYRPGGRYMWSQEEAAAALEGFPAVDVLIAHSPPLGVNDEAGDVAHVGLEALRDYVERARPRVLLHGHTYPVIQRRRLGDTIVRHVRGHALLGLPGPRVTA